MVNLKVTFGQVVPDELKYNALSLRSSQIQSENFFPLWFYLVS